MKVTILFILIGATLKHLQKIEKRLGNKRGREHPNDSVTKISQMNDKNPEYPSSMLHDKHNDYSYIYIKHTWFGFVRFYGIYHCRLFDIKSSLYIYIKQFQNPFCW